MNAEALKVTEDEAKDEEVRGYEEAKKDEQDERMLQQVFALQAAKAK